MRPVPQALAMAALFVLPLGAHEQTQERTRTVIVQQRQQMPTGWFGVRISDQAMIDQQSGAAFFDSYPVITQVDSGSPAATVQSPRHRATPPANNRSGAVPEAPAGAAGRAGPDAEQPC